VPVLKQREQPKLMALALKLVVSLLELEELVEFQLLARLLLQLHLGCKS
jgi:hypothetical protein